jgi:starch-binding outer membrane protein, SusD/RagB family
MKQLKKNITMAFLSGILFLTGCADQLDSILPRDQIAQNQLSESDITRVQNGVYAAMEELIFRYYFDGDIRGESFRGGPGFALNDPMSMAPGSSDVLQMWQRSFTMLKQVNFLIDTYEKSNNKQSLIIKKAGGEGYYFRALIYYTMVIRWGKLPIVDKRTNEVIPISGEDKVWEFIESDLKNAEALLPEFSDKYYVSQSANNALFARYYLAAKNYPKAIEYADKVISRNNFELASTSEEYASPFVVNTSSKELVFALVNQRTSGLLLFYQLVNDTDPTWNYAPSTDLYNGLYADNAIKSGDIRQPAVFSSTDNSRVLKFPNGLGGQFIHNAVASQSPIVITRIAELYLIKAEAQGNTTEGRNTLLQFMNKRYAQVSLGNMTDLEYQNLILDERYREFYGEGFRWYDLKRTGRLDLFKSLNGRNHLMYYPVPQNEIDLAGKENYPQNQGYGN